MTRITAVLLATALLLLGGCSTGLRLAYANLERLALWQIDEYVRLDDTQKTAFRREFAALKAWHHRQQLPGQIAALRRLGDALDSPAPAGAAAAAMLDTIDADALAAWNEARPGIERLLAQLDDAQIAAYDTQRRKHIDKDARRQADDSLAERRDDWLDAWRDQLKPWIGRPSPAQRALLDAAWDAEQPFLRSPDELAAARLASHARFVAILATRREPALTARLIEEADARERERHDALRRRERALIARLLDLADAPQRARFARAVRALADDLGTLPAAPASSAAGAP